MKKILMSLMLLMSTVYATETYRTGYSNGSNINFNLKDNVFMAVYHDLDGDLETRLEQMNTINTIQKVEYVFLNKGYHEFKQKGYYILKFVPVTDTEAVTYFVSHNKKDA